MISQDEKRNFARMSVSTQVTYTVLGQSQIAHHGTSGDLSATGLSMVTDYKLVEGDEISIVMNPSSERLPPFVAEGRVVRSVPDEDHPNKFKVSVELTKTE
jgi:c-di-GMP-binding flagellar brake protein YcgR